jgi:protein TonB
MIKCFLYIIIFIHYSAYYSQKKIDSINDIDFIENNEILIDYFPIVPVYNKGNKQLSIDIRNNITYPKSALKDSIQGKVYISYTIDVLGKINHPLIIKGVRKDLDEEALRVVKLLGDWTPAIENGKKVAVKYVLPINFKINNSL